ncbi:MAG: hypothetical protein D6816_04870 [Bacteroidetes bacterium]|nr:MAG: hypothetical protein D6816_04870 [Bacteroidota bacterium]
MSKNTKVIYCRGECGIFIGVVAEDGRAEICMDHPKLDCRFRKREEVVAFFDSLDREYDLTQYLPEEIFGEILEKVEKFFENLGYSLYYPASWVWEFGFRNVTDLRHYVEVGVSADECEDDCCDLDHV